MRIPLPRLPDWFTELVSGSVLLYALYTLVLFLVFLVVTFPHEVLVRMALERVNNPVIGVDIGSARFAFPLGYELQGLRFSALPVREGVPPVLEMTTLRVRPDYRSLIRGNWRTLVVSAELYGGTANGGVSQRDGLIEARLEWSGLELGRYRGFAQWLDEGRITGTVSGTGSMQATQTEPPAVTAELALDHGSLTEGKSAGIKIPDLHFNEAKAKVAMRNNRLDIQEFNAPGDEVAIQAGGNIALKSPATESALNLRATLQPGPKNPDVFKAISVFLPRQANPNGPATVTISGTFGAAKIK